MKLTIVKTKQANLELLYTKKYFKLRFKDHRQFYYNNNKNFGLILKLRRPKRWIFQ